MGLYDQFIIPSSGQYISTYAGAPVEEMQMLGQKLEQNYMQGIEGASAFNVMRDNIANSVLDKDNEMVMGVFDKAGKELKGFAEKGDYENALPAIMRASTQVSGNKLLNEAKSEAKKAQEYLDRGKKLLETQKIAPEQYDAMVKSLNNYEGVAAGDSVTNHFYNPAKQIDLYDAFIEAGKTVEEEEMHRRYDDERTGNLIDETITGRDKEELDFVIKNAVNANPELKAYYNDLVYRYGKDEANTMITNAQLSAKAALMAPKSKRRYVNYSDGSKNSSANKQVRMQPTVMTNIDTGGLDRIVDNYSSAKREFDKQKNLMSQAENQGLSSDAIDAQRTALEDAENAYNMARRSYDNVIGKLGETVDWEREYQRYMQDIHSVSPAEIKNGILEGTDIPKSSGEYKEYIVEFLMNNQNLKGRYNAGSDLWNKLKDQKELLFSGKSMNRGYLLAGETGSTVDKVNTMLTDMFKDNELTGMTLSDSGDQVYSFLNREYPNKKAGSERVTMTDKFSSNGQPIYQLSFDTISKEDGVDQAKTEFLYITSGDPYVSQMDREMVYDEMKNLYTSKNTDPTIRDRAESYLRRANYLPILKKRDIDVTGNVVDVPFHKGWNASVEKSGPNRYLITVKSPKNEVKTYEESSPQRAAEILQIEYDKINSAL